MLKLVNQRIFILSSLILLFCVFNVSTFQVSTTQFYFWFENKVHDSWILESFENSHFVTCLQKCRQDTNCSALALGPLSENEDDFVRSCYTLSEITETDCEEKDICEKKGFQVFHLSKPLFPTTTENPTTAIKTSTTTDLTSMKEVGSSTTIGSSTTVEESTSDVPNSTMQSPSTTSKPFTPTTETSPKSESPIITTDSGTSTIEILANTTSTSTTTDFSTTTKVTSTTISEVTSTSTTDSPATETETSSTILELMSTTTDSPATETETSSTISEPPSTTTMATSSSTGTSSTTTETSDCSDSDSPECQINNRRNSKCSGQEASIVCREPRDQLQVFGLVASAPLFSDAKMQVRCKNVFSQSIFKMKTRKDTYNPFDGTMGCKPDHTITGIDVCFQGELKYVSVECNPLQPDFTLEEETDTAGNSKQDPARAICPGEKSMISLRLNKDSNGEINVSIGCSKVIKK